MLIVALVVALLAASAARGETIELVDGQQVKGKVIASGPTLVMVQLSRTMTLRLPRAIVQRVWKDNETPPPPHKGDGTGMPKAVAFYPRMPDPSKAYPSIPVKREEAITRLTDEILKLDTPKARAKKLASLPMRDKALMPPAATIERWLAAERKYPQAAGKLAKIDLPWKGNNPRAVAFVGVPADYDPLKQAWPLVIALHGTENEPTAIASKFAGVVEHGCLLFAPCTTNEQEFWTSRTQWANIAAGIGHLADCYRIDPRRIVICGGSGGGMGTWGLSMTFPELFCAAGSFSGMPGVSPSMVSRLRNVPFYVLHGTNDHIPIAGPREMVAAMRKLNIEPVFVEYDGNHFPPKAETDKMSQWLQKAPPKADLSPRPAMLKFIKDAAKFKLPRTPMTRPTALPAARPTARPTVKLNPAGSQ